MFLSVVQKVSIAVAFIPCLVIGTAKANFVVKGDNGFAALISSQYQYVDNYLNSQSSQQSANQLKLTSKANLKIQHERKLFIVSALLNSVKNIQFTEDGFTDFAITPAVHYKFSHNVSSYLKGSITKQTEARGEGISYGQGGVINALDEKQSQLIKTGVLYGSENSKGRLFVELTHNKMNYTTRRDYSAVFDEVNTVVVSGFDYLLSGKSYLATELQYKNTEYENKPKQNKKQYAGLIGYKWQSTTITEIEALIGYEQVNLPENPALDDTNITWRVALSWHPLAQFKFNLTMNRFIESSNNVNSSYRINDLIKSSVVYAFNNEIDIKLQHVNNKNDNINTDFSETENQQKTQFSVSYQLNNRFSLSINYQKEKADNSNEENNYDRSGLSLGFDVIL